MDMKEVCKKVNKRNKKSYIAWLLVVVMVITCVNPATFALAAKNNSWNVNWTAEVDSDTIETYDNQASFYVEKGQGVNFKLELMEEDIDDPDRFKETFEISLTEYLYDLITENEESPIDWKMMSDFVLEAVGEDVKATDSNANKATDSNSRTRMHKIKLQFNKELRSEEHAETIELEDVVHSDLTFVAPEDMVLICTQKKNTYEIKMVPAASASDALLKGGTDNWDVEWTVEIEGKEVVDGEPVIVEQGEKVTTILRISSITTAEDRYDDTFTVSIPGYLYNLITDNGTHPIQWPQTTVNKDNKELFDKPEIAEGEDGTRTYTLKFAPFFRDRKDISTAINDADSSFSFTSDKEIKITYKHDKESDSLELIYSEDTYKPPSMNFDKEIIAAFSKDEIRFGNNVKAGTGDYVFYRIKVNPYNGSEKEHAFNQYSVFDYFDGQVYKFMDLNKPDDKAAIDLAIKDLYESLTKEQQEEFDKFRNNYTKWKDMTDGDNLPDLVKAAKKENTNLLIYANEESFTVKDTKTQYLYMCLKVKDEAEVNESWINNAFFDFGNGLKGTAEPEKRSYYDTALDIRATSVLRGTTTHSVLKVGNEDKYKEVLSNSNAAVAEGDYVTFKITGYGNQGSETAKIKEVSIYVPLGFEMIETSEELPDDFAYAKNPYNIVPVADAKGTPHVYPKSNDDNLKLFTDNLNYETDQLLGYADFYQVKTYTYEFETPVIDPVIFVTCKVNSLGHILTKAGNYTDTEQNLYAAEVLGYMMTAEVSKIINQKGSDMSPEDEDSLIDNDPFNDWYYKEGDSNKLKNDTLYLYDTSYSSGGKDNELKNHVRDLYKIYETKTILPKKDEDDFDLAIVYPLKGQKLTDKGAIKKAILQNKNSDIAKILNEIDEKYNLQGEDSYSQKYKLLSADEEIRGVGTIVPYVVYVNPYGAVDMNDADLSDLLPDAMSFLELPDQGGPVVSIFENIENDGYRYPATDKDGKSITVIMPDHSTLYNVKDFLSSDYQAVNNGKNVDFYPPGGLLNGLNKKTWDYSVQDNKLNIHFGKIEDNSFAVVYFAVVDKISNFYINTATVEWDGEKQETSAEIKKWESSGGSRAYGKQVSTTGVNGPYTLDQEIANISDGTAELYYKLHINITMNEGTAINYPVENFLFVDSITDPFGGNANGKISFEPIKVTEYSGGAEIASDNPPFEAEYDSTKKEVEITNMKAISGTTDCYIYFKIRYEGIPYGASIDNTFGDITTNVKTPMKLDLLKIDGNEKSIKLNGAQFSLSYDKDGKVPVNNLESKPITLTTEADGKSSAIFFPDEEQIYYDKFYLYLKETQAPSDYYELGKKADSSSEPTLIKLEIKMGADSKYIVNAIEEDTDYWELSHGERNEILITAKNYKNKQDSINAKAVLEAEKILIGRPEKALEAGEFAFDAKLVGTVNGSTVRSNAVSIALGSNLTQVTNDLHGDIKSPAVEFDKVGNYVFELSEVSTGGVANITYDKTQYYALVNVREDSTTEQLSATVTYHESFDETTQTVGKSIAFATPKFENTVKGHISIRKISASSGAPLAGAKFTISYQLNESSDDVWTPLYTDLETTGSEGSVSFELPEKYWNYNYKAIEMKAPYGYKSSKVGTIFFTVAQDGTIDTWNNNGTSGYVEVSNDKTTLIVKNQPEESGGGEDPDPTPTPPDKPGTVVPPGLYKGTVIDNGGIPPTHFMDDPAPLSGLPRTGDATTSALLLAIIMLAALGALGTIVYVKRKERKNEKPE